jgi:sugar lactone lactonase YvrE
VLPIPGGLNSANPLTLNDDGTRLWAAGCYGAPPENNAFVELDPTGAMGIINTLREDIPGCASNGMSFSDGFLYAPQPTDDVILRLDPDQGADQVPVVVTSGYSVPIGTAFDSNGDLYALAQGVGEVVRVDLDDPDTANNRTVIAKIPVGWADNIAISDDDRIFISSASDSVIAEVLPNGKLRTVVPGEFQLPFGVAVVGNTLYTAHISGLVGYDRSKGKQVSHFRAPFGVTEFPSTTSIVAWRRKIVLMSALTGDIKLWNPKTNSVVAAGAVFPPTDAQPFRGDLIVSQGNGEIVRLSKDLTPIDVVANVPGATGLARRGGDVYVAALDGTVRRIIDDGAVLASPVVVVDGLAAPEGIDIRGKQMYVVEGATETLTRINLRNGKRKTIATDLGLQDPSPLSAFGWFNDVNVVGNDIYVNADRANVIYEFPRKHHRYW